MARCINIRMQEFKNLHAYYSEGKDKYNPLVRNSHLFAAILSSYMSKFENENLLEDILDLDSQESIDFINYLNTEKLLDILLSEEMKEANIYDVYDDNSVTNVTFHSEDYRYNSIGKYQQNIRVGSTVRYDRAMVGIIDEVTDKLTPKGSMKAWDFVELRGGQTGGMYVKVPKSRKIEDIKIKFNATTLINNARVVNNNIFYFDIDENSPIVESIYKKFIEEKDAVDLTAEDYKIKSIIAKTLNKTLYLGLMQYTKENNVGFPANIKINTDNLTEEEKEAWDNIDRVVYLTTKGKLLKIDTLKEQLQRNQFYDLQRENPKTIEEKDRRLRESLSKEQLRLLELSNKNKRHLLTKKGFINSISSFIEDVMLQSAESIKDNLNISKYAQKYLSKNPEFIIDTLKEINALFTNNKLTDNTKAMLSKIGSSIVLSTYIQASSDNREYALDINGTTYKLPASKLLVKLLNIELKKLRKDFKDSDIHKVLNKVLKGDQLNSFDTMVMHYIGFLAINNSTADSVKKPSIISNIFNSLYTVSNKKDNNTKIPNYFKNINAKRERFLELVELYTNTESSEYVSLLSHLKDSFGLKISQEDVAIVYEEEGIDDDFKETWQVDTITVKSSISGDVRAALSSLYKRNTDGSYVRDVFGNKQKINTAALVEQILLSTSKYISYEDKLNALKEQSEIYPDLLSLYELLTDKKVPQYLKNKIYSKFRVNFIVATIQYEQNGVLHTKTVNRNERVRDLTLKIEENNKGGLFYLKEGEISISKSSQEDSQVRDVITKDSLDKFKEYVEKAKENDIFPVDTIISLLQTESDEEIQEFINNKVIPVLKEIRLNANSLVRSKQQYIQNEIRDIRKLNIKNDVVLKQFIISRLLQANDTLLPLVRGIGVNVNEVQNLRTLTRFYVNKEEEFVDYGSTVLAEISAYVDALEGYLDAGTYNNEENKENREQSESYIDLTNNTYLPVQRESSIFNKIAFRYATELVSNYESTHIEGKRSYYSYYLPTYSNDLLNKLKNTQEISNEEYKEFLDKEFGRFMWFKKGDTIMNDIVRLLYEDYQTLEENPNTPKNELNRFHILNHSKLIHSNGKSFNRMGDKEYATSLLVEYKKTGDSNYAFYTVPILSNSGSMEYIKLPRYQLDEVDSPENVLHHLSNVAKQEIDRINIVVERFVNLVREGHENDKAIDIDIKYEVNKDGTYTITELGGAKFHFLPKFNDLLKVNKEALETLVNDVVLGKNKGSIQVDFSKIFIQDENNPIVEKTLNNLEEVYVLNNKTIFENTVEIFRESWEKEKKYFDDLGLSTPERYTNNEGEVMYKTPFGSYSFKDLSFKIFSEGEDKEGNPVYFNSLLGNAVHRVMRNKALLDDLGIYKNKLPKIRTAILKAIDASVSELLEEVPDLLSNENISGNLVDDYRFIENIGTFLNIATLFLTEDMILDIEDTISYSEAVGIMQEIANELNNDSELGIPVNGIEVEMIEDEEGTPTYSVERGEHYEYIFPISKDSTHRELKDYFYNSALAMSNIIQLTVTDLAQYGDITNFQKRYKEVAGKTRRGNFAKDDMQHTLVIVDDEKPAKIFDEIMAIMDHGVEHGYISKAFRYNAKKAFTKVNASDGQAYRSPQSYIKFMEALGIDTTKFQRVLDLLEKVDVNGVSSFENTAAKRSEVASALDTIWGTIKPFLYTQVGIDSKVKLGGKDVLLKQGIQFKNSEFITLTLYDLLNRAAGYQSPKMKAISKFMKEHNIDTVQFESAVKVGSKGKIDLRGLDSEEDVYNALSQQTIITNENGESALNGDMVISFPSSELGIITETPQHFIDNKHQLIGTQPRKNILEGLDPGTKDNPFTIQIGDSLYSKAELIEHFDALNTANMYESFQTIKEKFGANSLEGRQKLRRVLINEITNSDKYPLDLIQAFELDENGEFQLPMFDPITSVSLEQLFNSIIGKEVVSQTARGGTLIQVSDFGYSDNLSIVFQDEEGNEIRYDENSPQTYEEYLDEVNKRLEDNTLRIKHYEAYMPAPSKEFYKAYRNAENGEINMDLINEKLLEAYSYRVPNESKYSMFPIKVKGFTPYQSGGMIMVPAEITTISGTDFDGDKLYTLIRDFKTKRGIYREIGTNNTFNSEEEALNYFSDKQANNEYVDKEFKQVIEKSYNIEPIEYDETKSILENSKAARNNRLLDIYRGVLQHSSVARNHFTPGGFADLQALGKLTELLNIIKSETSSSTKQAEFFIDNLEQKIIGLIKEHNSNELKNTEVESERQLIKEFKPIKSADVQTRIARATKKIYSMFDELKSSSKGMFEVLTKEYTEQLDPLAPSTQTYFQQKNAVASLLIGIYAVQNADHAVLQHTKLEFVEDSKIVIKEGKNKYKVGSVLHNQYMRDGKTLVSSAVAQFLAASVDDAKYPILHLLSQNLFTANITVAMIRSGFNTDEAILLMKQPIVQEIIKEVADSANQYVNGNDIIKRVIHKHYIKLSKINKNIWNDFISKLNNDKDTYIELSKEDLLLGVINGTNANERGLNQLKVLKAFQIMYERSQILNTVTFFNKADARANVPSSIAQDYAKRIQTLVMQQYFDRGVLKGIIHPTDIDVVRGSSLEDTELYFDKILNTDPNKKNKHNNNQIFSFLTAGHHLGRLGFEKLLGKNFIQYHPEVVEAIFGGNDTVGLIDYLSSHKLNEGIIKKFLNEMFLYSLTGTNFLGELNLQDSNGKDLHMSIKERREYILKNTPINFLNFIKKYELLVSNNPVLSGIGYRTKEGQGNLEFAILKFIRTGKMSSEAYNDLIEAFTTLYNTNEFGPEVKADVINMANQLFEYQVLLGGFNYNLQSFAHLISAEARIKNIKYKQAMGDLAVGKVNGKDFKLGNTYVLQFLRNHLGKDIYGEILPKGIFGKESGIISDSKGLPVYVGYFIESNGSDYVIKNALPKDEKYTYLREESLDSAPFVDYIEISEDGSKKYVFKRILTSFDRLTRGDYMLVNYDELQKADDVDSQMFIGPKYVKINALGDENIAPEYEYGNSNVESIFFANKNKQPKEDQVFIPKEVETSTDVLDYTDYTDYVKKGADLDSTAYHKVGVNNEGKILYMANNAFDINTARQNVDKKLYVLEKSAYKDVSDYPRNVIFITTRYKNNQSIRRTHYSVIKESIESAIDRIKNSPYNDIVFPHNGLNSILSDLASANPVLYNYMNNLLESEIGFNNKITPIENNTDSKNIAENGNQDTYQSIIANYSTKTDPYSKEQLDIVTNTLNSVFNEEGFSITKQDLEILKAIVSANKLDVTIDSNKKPVC